jgi:hypothetical protein
VGEISWPEDPGRQGHGTEDDDAPASKVWRLFTQQTTNPEDGDRVLPSLIYIVFNYIHYF